MKTMNKIRLGLDQLSVESFSTAAPQDVRGTVDAREASGGLCSTLVCGTQRQGQTCYSGCTADACEPTFVC